MTNTTAADAIEKRSAKALLMDPLAGELSALRLNASLTYGDPSPNPALRVDIDGSSAIGRFTWWSDGRAHVEALHVADGANLMSAHLAAVSTMEAVGALKVLVAVVGAASSGQPLHSIAAGVG